MNKVEELLKNKKFVTYSEILNFLDLEEKEIKSQLSELIGKERVLMKYRLLTDL